RVLTLASAAVVGASTPTALVLTVEDGRVARHDVQLGIRGDGAVEILAGIDERSEVLLPDGRPHAVGARVRVERD
ncbi:MAG: efflux RND transporter periplasmic adaptor subunit, partial [Proteobacteria bacterium]|nr:efflux RND transporter periplasmic adaptor subunit [Pseudomonadota bacterium]